MRGLRATVLLGTAAIVAVPSLPLVARAVAAQLARQDTSSCTGVQPAVAGNADRRWSASDNACSVDHPSHAAYPPANALDVSESPRLKGIVPPSTAAHMMEK